jgi:hypothetical protein
MTSVIWDLSQYDLIRRSGPTAKNWIRTCDVNMISLRRQCCVNGSNYFKTLSNAVKLYTWTERVIEYGSFKFPFELNFFFFNNSLSFSAVSPIQILERINCVSLCIIKKKPSITLVYNVDKYFHVKIIRKWLFRLSSLSEIELMLRICKLYNPRIMFANRQHRFYLF